ncbi:MAG TPA: hypothetical protein VGP78_02470, partial [Solirubrobacteraceae bacterium]|nr:hypothetical protein [Solirubrobacteraceae bacterium]
MPSRRPLAAAVAAAAVMSPGVAMAAPWSAPQDLGAPTDYVTASGVAALPSGSAVLGWTTRSQPTGAGGLPGAISVIADPQSNDGERGAIGIVDPGGSGRMAAGGRWSLEAGPVASAGGRAIAAVSRVVGGDDDGNRYVRLSLLRLSATGRVLGTHVLVTRAVVRSASLAANPRGEAVVAWVQARPFIPGRRELGPHAFQELQTRRAVSITAAGRLGATRTLESSWANSTDYGGQVTTAVGGDGRALVAGQAADRPVARLAAAALPDGTFGVAWSAVTASAGHLVHPVRVALGSRDGRFAAASTIAPSGAVGSV